MLVMKTLIYLASPLMQDYAPTRILLRPKGGALTAQAVRGVRTLRVVGDYGTNVLEITDGTPVEIKLAQLRNLSCMSASPVHYRLIMHACTLAVLNPGYFHAWD
jgi:hypothetical protein